MESSGLSPAVVLDAAQRSFGADRIVGPVTFQVPAGSCYGLVGHNGAGKTTLMRMILGLDRPTGGTVTVRGRPVTFGQPQTGVSGMIEEPRFFPWMNARDNLRACSTDRRIERHRLDAVLGEVGLAGDAARPVREFSQGMRQRLGIARVLLADPEVMLLDEPTNGLDPLGIRWLRQYVRTLAGAGRTVILSSHLLHEVQQATDHFAMLRDGRLVATGATADLPDHDSLEEMYITLSEGR